MKTPLDTIFEEVSRVTGEDQAFLSEDMAIEDLDIDDEDYRRIFERAAETHGVPIEDIVNTMPLYRIVVGDNTMWSLQLLGAVSAKARALVADYTTRVEMDTIASMAASIRERRYVRSGLQSPPLHMPFSMPSFGGWMLAFFLPFLISLYAAFWPFNPICRFCAVSEGLIAKTLSIGGGISLALLGLAVLPGLVELYRVHQKDRRRDAARSRTSAQDSQPG
ncbi:MAG: hypothetical protein AAGK82_00255 [Pseudomonadota bacterium]